MLAAVTAWRLSYTVTGRKHPQEALDLAMTATAALERAMRAPSPEQLSVYGALHLAAATAAAACYDRATTETVLAKARGIADHTGEANHMGTAFGPVNVAIHAISASLRLGDPRTATETGEALDTAAMPVALVGRRTQVNLDLAPAYAMCRKDAAAVNLLRTRPDFGHAIAQVSRRRRWLRGPAIGQLLTAVRGASPGKRISLRLICDIRAIHVEEAPDGHPDCSRRRPATA